jgi:hypothetical protein
MEGGSFLTSGAETCVFKPAVKCAQGDIPPGDFVSRIVENNGIEEENQDNAKDALTSAMAKIHGNAQATEWLGGRPLSMYFNFAIGLCTPAFSAEDLVKEDGSPHTCEIPIRVGRVTSVTNLITPRQDDDVRRMTHSTEETVTELRKFLHAVLLFNNEGVVHTDAHFGNIAWMGDHIVLHDWGRLVQGAAELKDFFFKLDLDTRNGRDAMIQEGKHMQVIGPCRFLNVCPILEKPEILEKFIKLYDTISLFATIAMIKKIGRDVVNKHFVIPIKDLLVSDATPDEVSLEAHNIVDTFFDEVENKLLDLVPPPLASGSPAPPPMIKRTRIMGGYYMAKGADTCVYSPPVKCRPGTTEGEIPPGDYVSRVVPAIKDEWEAQKIVKEKIESFSPGIENNCLARQYLGGRPLTAYFNFATAVCQPSFRQEDMVDKDGNPKLCGRNIQLGPDNRAQNLITPRQGPDLENIKEITPAVVDEMRKYFHAVLFLNSMNVAHMDAHFGNVAWMDGHLVMHDWGRIVIDIDEFRGDLQKYHMDDPAVRQGTIQNMRFPQFVTPCKVLDTCPTLMSTDEQLSRFIKVYDVLSMISSLTIIKVGEDEPGLLERRLVEPIEQVLQGFATEVQVSIKAHEIVENFFQELKKDKEDMAELQQMILALPPIDVPQLAPDESPPQVPQVPPPRVQTPVPDVFGPNLRLSLSGGARKLSQTKRFCKCIKKVKRTFRNEKGPIAVCVKSVLQTRGRTLRRFKCGKHAKVVTQSLKRK